ncbi:uncharacterized protein LOC107809538 isoform X1 [Nicotiana tabacum]|uniref:Uncharacterized protein LOC107809538 isoform X1 n=5 Tax=Nicotiana TaxID=4085 RepID=A0A1S4BLB2_TOBAC|nr:PREDICTED: uncharacterized protein LOC104239467 isoform X1 [Nicotiana sylvestris]XP_016489676.1 PREDICTED: uncharacterized protein LOC107809538 isoform X1 [Nicotiana tabacum]
MSKKMKRVALDSSKYVVFEDAKARLKHQTLFQDFQELHKETSDMRDKLEDAKMRKQRLLAEIHYLRRRHKYLLRMKSSHPEEQERAALPNPVLYCKNGMKDRLPSKKEARLYKLPPLPLPKQKGKMHVAKEAAPLKTLPDIFMSHKQTLCIGKDDVLHSTVSSLNHKSRVYSGKEVPFRKAVPAFDLNQNDRSFTGNGSVSRSTAPIFDLNQETLHGGKDVTLPSRAPVIDLNEISMGEEEPQANTEPMMFEDPKRGLIRNLNDDQPSDLKLSICRNLGEGTSRVEKRKISWQDPVALRV